MKEKKITEAAINRFYTYLCEEEKSQNTREKYIRDVKKFVKFIDDNYLTKDIVIAYKHSLIKGGYAIKSINSMLTSLNSFFSFLSWNELHIKLLKIQQQIFCPEEKELTRAEYERLCYTAKQKHNERLCLILQTICSTGIRVSELQFVTVDAIRKGEAIVSLKGKTRTVIIPKDLQKKLFTFIGKFSIHSGPVFVTKSGKPMNRTNIWKEMKSICNEANVNPQKVFPHNLRHLFARVFYSLEKDIAKLADILGHSNINTTRLYIIATCMEHRKQLEQMKLVIKY